MLTHSHVPTRSFANTQPHAGTHTHTRSLSSHAMCAIWTCEAHHERKQKNKYKMFNQFAKYFLWENTHWIIEEARRESKKSLPEKSFCFCNAKDCRWTAKINNHWIIIIWRKYRNQPVHILFFWCVYRFPGCPQLLPIYRFDSVNSLSEYKFRVLQPRQKWKCSVGHRAAKKYWKFCLKILCLTRGIVIDGISHFDRPD